MGDYFPYYNRLFIMFKQLKSKHQQLTNYFFPSHYIINLHYSHLNINTLFYVRLFSFLYLTGIYLWAFATTPSILSNVIYLTMQGYFLTWLYFLLVMQDYVANGMASCGQIVPKCKNLKYYIQLIFETGITLQIPITLIFWGFLFNILIHTEGITLEILILNANLHAGPLICLTLDFIFNVYEFRRCHFYWIAFFGTIYMIINLIYSQTVHIIYAPINWTSVLSYVLVLSAYLLAFGCHYFCGWVFGKYKKKNMEGRIMDGLIDREEEDGRKDKRESVGENENMVSSVIRQQL